jgi:hypothetical protein
MNVRPTRQQISEIVTTYRAWSDGRKWRVRDTWSGEVLDGEFSDEFAAKAGASLAAADRILALFDGGGR